MADRPRYEAAPSPHFLAALRVAVPGFEPTPPGWFEVERELKRRLQIRDQAAYAADHQACWKWSEDEVLEVFKSSSAAPPPAADRPAFPARPLDPWCVAPAEISAAEKAEIVRWVRKAQPDFDPEGDPDGWISVAVKVRAVGYGEEEVRRMGYPELEHVFRSLWPKMNRESTGNIFFAAETSTATIVRIGGAPDPEPQPKARTAEADGDEGKGRPKRKMRPEEHLLLLYFRDPKVATLESRSLPAVAEAAFGESFCDRYYRDTELYGEWRAAVEEAVRRHGPGWMEGDVLEEGLEIYAAKPGRSDKRPTLDPKHEAAVRDFLRDAGNAAARAKARREDGGK